MSVHNSKNVKLLVAAGYMKGEHQHQTCDMFHVHKVWFDFVNGNVCLTCLLKSYLFVKILNTV